MFGRLIDEAEAARPAPTVPAPQGLMLFWRLIYEAAMDPPARPTHRPPRIPMPLWHLNNQAETARLFTHDEARCRSGA